MTDEPGGGDETVAVLDAAKKAKRSAPVDATSHSNGANVTSMMRDTISEQHSRLRDAMRRARLNETERRDVIVSLREGEVARLEMLQDLLEDVFASVPEESDLFDGVDPAGQSAAAVDRRGSPTSRWHATGAPTSSCRKRATAAARSTRPPMPRTWPNGSPITWPAGCLSASARLSARNRRSSNGGARTRRGGAGLRGGAGAKGCCCRHCRRCRRYREREGRRGRGKARGRIARRRQFGRTAPVRCLCPWRSYRGSRAVPGRSQLHAGLGARVGQLAATQFHELDLAARRVVG